jgi:hypothetical protein
MSGDKQHLGVRGGLDWTLYHEAEESDVIEGSPCLVCGNVFYERTDEGEDECIECGAPKEYQPGTYDWSVYVMSEGEGKLFDLRYGVHGFVGLVESMRKALRSGDIEVKVSTR